MPEQIREPSATASRALVPLSSQADTLAGDWSPGPVTLAATPSADAGFLAQLLACRDGVPAYRVRRRAEPELAARCYRDALARV